jgi:phenylalanyl-tRNA synthetase alpha chain
MTEDEVTKGVPRELREDPVTRELVGRALERISAACTLDELEGTRVSFLGRKGEITSMLARLKDLPAKEKPRAGRLGNLLKRVVEEKLQEREEEVESATLAASLEAEAHDITLPGRFLPRGKRHLITSTIEEIEDIFIGLGYEVVEGPEVELDYYNFEALNTPDDHPSKSLSDTFYVTTESGRVEDVLLRCHTSPVQVRVMEKRQPPLFVISPGKAFRRDVPDASHSPMFHQVEGFAVDTGITFGDLKGTLESFCRSMFGEDRQVRFRPHFFPFTEPSAEVDVTCMLCDGKGCRLCKGSGWLEILGSGMIDPNVFKHVGYDPEEYAGFAFGMGVERIALLKYGIPDIRMLFENDLRFLKQF